MSAKTTFGYSIPASPATHRVVMSFGAGSLRNNIEVFTGSEDECLDYVLSLGRADIPGRTEEEIRRIYESGTNPFIERTQIEEIEPGDDPRWP